MDWPGHMETNNSQLKFLVWTGYFSCRHWSAVMNLVDQVIDRIVWGSGGVSHAETTVVNLLEMMEGLSHTSNTNSSCTEQILSLIWLSKVCKTPQNEQVTETNQTSSLKMTLLWADGLIVYFQPNDGFWALCVPVNWISSNCWSNKTRHLIQ